MDDRQVKFRVGLVTIAVMIVFFVLIGLNTPLSISVGGKQTTVQLRALRAPGVGRNTHIRRDGVLIGRVESTQPVQGGVLIKAQVTSDNVPLQSDSAYIQPSSLFGDAVIDFEQDPTDPNRSPVTPEMVIQADAARDPLAALAALDGKMTPALESMTKAGDSISSLTSRLNTALGDDLNEQRFNELMTNLNRAAVSFTSTMDSLNSIVGQPGSQERIRQTIDELPKLIEELRTVVASADTAFASLDGAVVSAEANLKNIESITQPLSERGPELVQHLTNSLENLDLVLADAQRFAKTLNNGQGSLGKFVSERELYDNLNTTIYNANQTILRINELAKQVRPILYDVRVATDKIAREPGNILRGAIQPGPGIK
ncbi:MAG: hypothetical protein KDA37_11175 [Planctomycetales bacterium]|nr:hypothetical protein [Planctomycetales bacterium]